MWYLYNGHGFEKKEPNQNALLTCTQTDRLEGYNVLTANLDARK